MTSIRKYVRTLALLTHHEVSEAIHSRKMLLFLLLYLVGGSVGVLRAFDIFCDFQASMQTSLMASKTQCPGSITTAFMQTPAMRDLLTRWVNDQVLAIELQSRPPLSLLIGWLLFSYVPFIVALTSADCVSSELASGSSRYVLTRVDRRAWSLGKLFGQTALTIVGVCLAAIAACITGLLYGTIADPIATCLWVARLTLHSLPYAFAYVGLIVGLSHLTRSVPLSRVFALGVVIVEGVLRRAAMGEHQSAGFLEPLLPYSTVPSLWRKEWVAVLPSFGLLMAFGIVTFALSSSFRLRRDM